MALWLFYITLLATLFPATPFQYVPDAKDRATATLNDRPIIGILAQESSQTVEGIYPEHASHIPASYVKFLEAAGARVVPIWINQDKPYYTNLLDSINGVLLPGGATWFNNTNGYADAGAIVLDYATSLNAAGDFFPVWGTCLGMELMFYLAADSEPRITCYSQNVALPLDFKPDYFESRLFQTAPTEIINILSTQNVTANFHSYCITEETMATLGLDQDWRVLSLNKDADGIEFVSTAESRTLPFYGVMFHPEKNGFEFKSTKNIPHSREAILVMQYFANFFVGEARKNHHSFSSETVESAALMYNYPATYTGDRLSYEQLYFFD